MLTRASAIHRTLGTLGVLAASAVPVGVRAATQSLSVGQIGNNSAAFFPLFVAMQHGYFRDGGIEVSLTNFQSGAVQGAALTSGSIDVGCGVMTDVFSLLKASRPVKVVGSLVEGYYVDLIASDQFLGSAKIDRRAPLRKKIEALRGKRIGITGPGSGTEALVIYLAKGAGLDPMRDLELVNVGTDQGAILTQLKTGRLDAVSFAWPLSMVAETQNIGHALVMPAEGDVPAMRGELHGVMYARPETIDKRADALAAFVRAIGRAQHFIHGNKPAARDFFTKYDAQLDGAIVERLNRAYLPVLPQSPRVGIAAFAKALDFHRVTGFASATGDAFADVVATEFIARALR